MTFLNTGAFYTVRARRFRVEATALHAFSLGDFNPRGEGSVRVAHRVAVDVVVEVEGQGIRGVTGRNGTASLDLTTLASGDYFVTFAPRGPAASTQPASSRFVPSAVTTRYMFRSYRCKITVDRPAETISGGVSDPAGGTHGHLVECRRKELVVDLKPDWMAVPDSNQSPRGGTAIDMVVLHHTGGDSPSGALNSWTAEHTAAPHYLIDRDGHITKHVTDDQASHHAGNSYWTGQPACNARSIGIEIAHHPDSEYTEEQYVSTIRLVEDLLSTHGIPRHHVIGHSDITVDPSAPTRWDHRRGEDPGPKFDWPRLEAQGLGLRPQPMPINMATAYGGFFATNTRLREGRVPADPAAAAVYTAAVRELQTQLLAIGYQAVVNGVYDAHLSAAIRAFRLRFETASRRVETSLGRVHGRWVEWPLATLIKQVTPW